MLDVLKAPMAGAKGVNDDVRSAACTTAADAIYMCEDNRESAMKAGFIPALQRLITSSRYCTHLERLPFSPAATFPIRLGRSNFRHETVKS